jgi:hypothetical protein
MEPKRLTPLASSKKAYCLWYEFALIAVNMTRDDLRAFDADTPETRAAIKKARRFYKPWDLDKRLDPEKWWKSHLHLFQETREVRLLKVGEKPRDPNALIIEVPMIYSATRLKRVVGELILREMYKRTRFRYGDIAESSAKFRLTPGSNIKYLAMAELQVFIKTCFAYPDLKGIKLLKQIENAFDRRTKETGIVRPITFTVDWNDEFNVSSKLRNMRKTYWRARSLLQGVLVGAFP